MKILPQCYLPTLFLTALFLVAPMSAATSSLLSAEEPESSNGMELFESKILPVLVSNCYECHSKASETTEGGLELDSPSGMLRGGDSGPMFEAHHADGNSLLRMLRHEADFSPMPPEEKLSEEIIAAFEEWIGLGAPDSREDEGPTAKEERLNKGKQHWAFQKPIAVSQPVVKDSSWARDPMIDSFVLARIEAAGMKPVADATRQTLVRRLYFDLVGLPPTPQQIDTFVADESPDAIEKVVDQLLASPQFGERWGRHWLDVVRFAESSGMEFNFTYPHAWPFRDYVIDSFNSDKPFDIFLQEQIAGDLLPSTEGVSAEELEARRVAPSMLAFGPKRHNSSGTDFRMNIVDDQIDVVMKATMAMTVSCARCHDHKFDPIPTTDYYALAGIFLSTEPLYGTIKQKYSNTPTDLLPLGADGKATHEAAEKYEETIVEAGKPLVAQREKLKEATAAEELAKKEQKAATELLVVITTRQSKVAEEGSPNELAAGDSATNDTADQDNAQAELDSLTATLAEATAAVEASKAEIAKLESSVSELKKNRPPRPRYAMSVRDREKPADTKVAVRGNFRTLGDVVPRGFLSAVNVPDAKPIDKTTSGRLELAKWITSPDNPLTARVMVNRIWHHLFGRGIVPTVDNFGLIGKPPTHPELLDSLALRFVQDGWSTRRMIRAMVLSRTYQLSSQTDKHNLAIDPDNRLLWRATPRRLEAETIRDAMLAVSGQLDSTRPIGSTVTALGDKMARTIATEKIQPPSNHRSVYLPVVRDYIPELFDLFDFPSPSLVTGNRAVTNVPSQALYLRNSKFVATQTELAAKRLLASTEAGDDRARVTLAMRWSLGRAPTKPEQDAALAMIEGIMQAETDDAKKPENVVRAWSAWFLTLFTTAEFRFLVDA